MEVQARFELAYPNFAGSAVAIPVTAPCWHPSVESNHRLRFQRPPYWPLYERGMLVRAAGVEPALQASEAHRLPQSFALLTMERAAGFEPASSIQLPLSCFVGRRVTRAKIENDATSDDASDGRSERLIRDARRRGARATLHRQCSRGIGAAGGYRSRSTALRGRHPSQ